jgi:hypothetical protein
MIGAFTLPERLPASAFIMASLIYYTFIIAADDKKSLRNLLNMRSELP